MNKITLINSTRILQFLQRFKLDFNEHSVWSYSRKKFHDSNCTKSLISEAFNYLITSGHIERTLQPGYFRLTKKGQHFKGWDNEHSEDHSIVDKPIEKGWINWLLPRKKSKKSV